MSMYLTGVHLIFVHLTGMYLIGVHFTSMHLIGECLIGVHLIDVHLMGAYLTSLYLMRVSHRAFVLRSYTLWACILWEPVRQDTHRELAAIRTHT
jgi:hypothetical protein